MIVRRWEAIGVSMVGGPYASRRFPSPSKLRGIRTPNKGMVIPFSYFFFFVKGKRVNA